MKNGIRFEIDKSLVDYAKSFGFEKEGFWGMVYKHNGGVLLINVVGGKEVFYNYNKESDIQLIKGASAWDFGLEVIIEHFKERKLEELWIMS